MRPYAEVRVRFDNNDYDNVCDRYGGGPDRLDQWRDLGDLLHGRAGWHFNVVNDGEALWSLGVLGSSLLNISVDVDRGGFHCFDYTQDDGDWLDDLAAVEAWLAPREDQAKQIPADYRASMRADDWWLFKGFTFELQVSWSDGTYAAAAKQLAEVAFGSTLEQGLSNAAEMICSLFEAPRELASQLKLTVELDLSATRALRGL